MERWSRTEAGQPLNHSACNQFKKRRLQHGDSVYVVSSLRGRLALVGKLVVDRIVDQATAEKLLKEALWEARDHAIAIRGSETVMRRDLVLTRKQASRLEFVAPDGSTGCLRFRPDGKLDQQTLRALRRLTSRSAALVDIWLGTDVATAATIDEDELRGRTAALIDAGNGTLPVGNQRPKKVESMTTSFERLPGVRVHVTRRAMGRCELCGSKALFKDRWGQPFFEIHHVRTLASGGSDTVQNAVCLCPNCHRRCHYSADAEAARRMLYEQVKELRCEGIGDGAGSSGP
jgi:hypothetical protein